MQIHGCCCSWRMRGRRPWYSETASTAVLNSVVAGSDTVVVARNDSMVVHRFGPTTAVVTGWLVVGGRGAAGAFRRRYRFTDTWVKRGGGWQIVAAQDYVAPSR
ncbi:MAG: hypothetical protein DMD66_07710 [Gemmatimonadetes bacterium]|nr:MAG: hypothetical protein DMD66_07710 [Gemmatimonadota bacterium]